LEEPVTHEMVVSIFPEYYYEGISDPQETILFFISKYAEGFLRFVPRKIRNYPSHGIDHSVNIIRLINDFTLKWAIKLNENERFILYTAAWLHDIGCIKDRGPHNKISVDILLKDDSICNYLNSIDNDLLFILQNVIESHSSSYDIDTVPETKGIVRVRLICAIFRLIDACEITNFKCPAPVFIEIKEDLKNDDDSPDSEAIEFWEGHMNIKDIGFLNKPNIDILINDRRKTKKIVERLKKEIESVQHIFQKNMIDVPVVQERARQEAID
jgi:hypothetical protein